MGNGENNHNFSEEHLNDLVERCRTQGTMQLTKGTYDHQMAEHLEHHGLLKAAGQTSKRAYYKAPAEGRKIMAEDYSVTRAYH